MSGQYVDIDGVSSYYEVYGDGKPMVLLHGGLATVESFFRQTPKFAGRFRVYLPERRAHGRTPDVAGDLSYEAMTAETIAFFDQLDLRDAHLVGWSDGAVIGMLLAGQRPELVDRMVLISGNVMTAGMTEEFLAETRQTTAETVSAEYSEWYLKTTPDGPEHFPVVLEKFKRLWLSDPIGSWEPLAAIGAPTLVMSGDRDVVKPEHTLAIASAIPAARACILPGSHLLPIEADELVNRLIYDFVTDRAG